MPIPVFTGLPPDPSFTEVAEKVNKLTKELQNILLGLDTLNIDSIHAKVIEAETITGDKIQANAITAGKIDVNELSAISANLGHIVAGIIESVEIYGSYISTQKEAYPRSEMSTIEHLFAAYKDANNHVKISPDLSGSPGQRFTANGVTLGSLTTYLGYLELWVPQILRLTAPSLRINGWGSLYSVGAQRTLQQELNDLWAAINNKASISHTHSVSIPNHNHGNTANQTSGGGTFTVS